jgi:XTP/dITP diphosphohydrolase
LRAADARTLLLATRSADKAREIRQILAARTDLRLLSLEDAGVEPDDAEDDLEAFDTFAANALAKAAWFASRAGMPTLADDSGLVVHALGGEPGVRSKRFAGSSATGRALDHDNNRELLRRLADVETPRRTAHYVCAAALVDADGTARVALGSCDGRILHEPAGAGGFGYDPYFHVAAAGASFGQLDAAEKNRLSHRARAFRALAAAL